MVRILQAWGQIDRLKAVAYFPQALRARNAITGQVVGEKRLGQDTVRRYKAPYATIARADMHSLLVAAVAQTGSIDMHLGHEVTAVTQDEKSVHLQVQRTETGSTDVVDTKLLVGADGVWSRVRAQVMRSGGPPKPGARRLFAAHRQPVGHQQIPHVMANVRLPVAADLCIAQQLFACAGALCQRHVLPQQQRVKLHAVALSPA